jgi:hypothetical protein
VEQLGEERECDGKRKKKGKCIPCRRIPDTKQTLELVTHPPPAVVLTTTKGQTALTTRVIYLW